MVGHIVSAGAIFGLMAACFTSLMGQPRIFYRMAKDGLWFPMFAKVNSETQVHYAVLGELPIYTTRETTTNEFLPRSILTF